MVAGLLVLGWLIFRGKRNFLRLLHLAAAAAVLGGALAGYGHWRHFQNRRIVTETPAEQMPEIGKHLIVGWLGFEETRTLAAKGAIAGVFLTRKDFPLGVSSEEIRRTVDALQTARRDAGLPSLWVATDQEGGPVARLSPPLPVQAALGLRC